MMSIWYYKLCRSLATSYGLTKLIKKHLNIKPTNRLHYCQSQAGEITSYVYLSHTCTFFLILSTWSLMILHLIMPFLGWSFSWPTHWTVIIDDLEILVGHQNMTDRSHILDKSVLKMSNFQSMNQLINFWRL